MADEVLIIEADKRPHSSAPDLLEPQKRGVLVVVNPGAHGCVAVLQWVNGPAAARGSARDPDAWLARVQASLHAMPMEHGKIAWHLLRALLLERIPDFSPAVCTAYIHVVDHASGRRRSMGGGAGASGRAKGVLANTQQSLERAIAEGEEVAYERACVQAVHSLTRESISQPFTLRGEYSGEGSRDDKAVRRAKVLFPGLVGELASTNAVQRSDALLLAAHVCGLRMKPPQELKARKRRAAGSGGGRRAQPSRRFPGQPHFAAPGDEEEEEEEDEEDEEEEEEEEEGAARAAAPAAAAAPRTPAKAPKVKVERGPGPALPWGNRSARAPAPSPPQQQQQQQRQQQAPRPSSQQQGSGAHRGPIRGTRRPPSGDAAAAPPQPAPAVAPPRPPPRQQQQQQAPRRGRGAARPSREVLAVAAERRLMQHAAEAGAAQAPAEQQLQQQQQQPQGQQQQGGKDVIDLT